MGSLNRATLLGNVGKNPEIKNLPSGNKVAMFSLATTVPAYVRQTGEQVPARTEWHSIVAWAGLATIAQKFLQQGSQVYVEGEIRYRTYDNQQGQKRYVTEIVAENIVLLKNGDQNQSAKNAQSTQYPPYAYQSQQQAQPPQNSDNLPF